MLFNSVNFFLGFIIGNLIINMDHDFLVRLFAKSVWVMTRIAI